MIPLIVSPHRWRVLDANAGIFSAAYATTGSFTQHMRYTKTVTDMGGAWFAAVTDDGRAVGLSTARPIAPDAWRVDAFTQSWFSDAWSDLIEAAIGAAAAAGAGACRIDVSPLGQGKDRPRRVGRLPPRRKRAKRPTATATSSRQHASNVVSETAPPLLARLSHIVSWGEQRVRQVGHVACGDR